MGYDPFVAGPCSVGARSVVAIDKDRRDRQLPFEVWYPQSGLGDPVGHAGRPLVLFSHASYGHRRQSSFLCSHLASHGYVVAAADHTGNTAEDSAERSKRAAAGEVLSPKERDAFLKKIIADRVPDLRFLMDQILSGAAGDVTGRIDHQRVGLIGWSFGGWAVLSALEIDDRFRAVVALAPAGNSKPLPGIIPATLTFAWKRDVPALYLVAERDRFTPLPGQAELFERTPSSKRMFVLRGADHDHFADEIVDEGACPREQAHLFTRGLALAHMDAVLKDEQAAHGFWRDDPVAGLRERGVDAFETLSVRVS